MVNLVEAQKPFVNRLAKMAGLRPMTIDLEPGTAMHFWVPKSKTAKPSAPAAKVKPAVVLIHGFAAEGMVTWQFQFGVLVNTYDLYIPDLFFFGGSTTASPDRSPAYQARCIARALGMLGVSRCDAVGFSYGGMVAFKLAEAAPELVRSLTISGSVIAMTEAINEATMRRLGAASAAELLMPETVEKLRVLLRVSMYKKMWFPDKLYKDYLKAMFTNRKERMELLEGLLISSRDAKIPNFSCKIFLLWGENDNVFSIDLAKKMKEQLREKTMLAGISKAGHLLHVERPCAYNRMLKRFLAHVNSGHADDQYPRPQPHPHPLQEEQGPVHGDDQHHKHGDNP